MGKKSTTKSSTSSSSSTGVGSSAVAASEAGSTSRTRSHSFLALVTHVENTLKSLEANTVSATTRIITLDEAEHLLHVLEGDYKALAIRNKVDSLKEERLQSCLQEVESTIFEFKHDIQQIQEEIQQGNGKVDKLEKLSQMLASRLKAADNKMADEMKTEKVQRLEMSTEFSEKIKDISAKLDTLSQRRELLLSENERLKQVLKHCLEDYEREQEYELKKELKLQQQQKKAAAAAAMSSSSSSPTSSGEPIITATTVEAEVAEVEGTEINGEALQREEEARRCQQEASAMEMEDDMATIVKLRSVEDDLKLETIRYMEIFDSFQYRLTDSNKMFKLKQAKVEEITQDIRSLEKNNQKTKTHITECTVSANTMLDSVDKVRFEKDKILKMVEKQRALIDKFQDDILQMEQK